MRKIRLLTRLTALALPFMAAVTSCHDAPEYSNDLYGNFDALWNIMDQRYCYFEEKGVDWDEIGRKYRARLDKDGMNVVDYFDLCTEMLDELKDGHVNLSSNFNTSYYRKWWTDYPQDFNLRTLREYYLGFDYLTTSGMSYKMLPDSIGYVYIGSFSNSISELNLDYMLAYLHKAKGLIIDIRDNGGGMLTNIRTLVSRFIDRTVPGGYIIHKTGPGHNDFSEPYPYEYEPADENRIRYYGPILLLTNRSCYSAANDFTAVMKTLPNVAVVGARTGGGGGMPFSSELPIGWSLRLSACPLLDPEGNPTENGIDPTPGGEMHSPAVELAEGRDAILDFAIAVMLRLQEEEDDAKKDIRKYLPAIRKYILPEYGMRDSY